MTKPLSNVRVLDLSKVLAGPLCGQMLADMGADVVKVEPPTGDENRRWAPLSPTGESCNFMAVNRGKRAITVNLKSPRGFELLMQLLANTDVLIHNFLPSVAQRLGLSFEALHTRFPALVVCSISGYGKNGPLRDNPGYDAVIAAFSGVMSITGEPGRTPVRSGVSAIDLTTGILAYCGILSALWSRSRDGVGQHVHGSLLETAISLLNFNAVGWMEAQVMPTKQGSGIWYLVPCQIFDCKDGQIYVAALNDAVWRRFCEVLGRADLLNDPGLTTSVGRMNRRDDLIATLEKQFKTRTFGEWEAVFEGTGVAFSPVHTVDQALSHPQVLANNMVAPSRRSNGSERSLLGLPFKVGAHETPSALPPPQVGEHTDVVLRDYLGLNENDVESLRESGAI